MWGKPLILATVLPAFILTGCATTQSCSTTASDRDRSDKAVVAGWGSGWGVHSTHTRIEYVDGLPPFRRPAGGCLSGPSLIDPGLRVLSVSGTYHGWIGQDTGRVDLEATLRAGRTYQIKAEYSGELMTLWVEDEELHVAVSERRSTDTTYWINWCPFC